MWVCLDIFYADEEASPSDTRSAYAPTSVIVSGPGRTKSYCSYSLCRMCANEKRSSGIGELQ